MSGFASLLRHQFVIQRAMPGMPDRYGHTEPSWPDGETVAGLVQSIKGQEILGPALGGTVISDVRIFVEPVELDEQDRLKDVTAGHHDAIYEVQFVEDAGGQIGSGSQGDHLEVFARNISSGEAPS